MDETRLNDLGEGDGVLEARVGGDDWGWYVEARFCSDRYLGSCMSLKSFEEMLECERSFFGVSPALLGKGGE